METNQQSLCEGWTAGGRGAGLRHSFASLAYHLGWPEMQTMVVGGWSNYETVHKIYTHLAARDTNDAVDKMVKFFADY